VEPQSKNAVHGSDTPIEIPVPVTPKRESGDDSDVEIINVRESGNTHFRDKLYGIRKESDTLTIGNSAIDLNEPGVIAVKGERFNLTRGLWHLLTRNDIHTGTISPNDMQRYKTMQMTSAHLTGHEPEGNIKLSRFKIY
jgi:hypothetical protein